MANYQNILRQAHQAIADVADNADSWRAFLRSAAYTTHYAFPNQALIYSQRPGATMLATSTLGTVLPGAGSTAVRAA